MNRKWAFLIRIRNTDLTHLNLVKLMPLGICGVRNPCPAWVLASTEAGSLNRDLATCCLAAAADDLPSPNRSLATCWGLLAAGLCLKKNIFFIFRFFYFAVQKLALWHELFFKLNTKLSQKHFKKFFYQYRYLAYMNIWIWIYEYVWIYICIIYIIYMYMNLLFFYATESKT